MAAAGNLAAPFPLMAPEQRDASSTPATESSACGEGINLQFTYKSFLEIGKEYLAQKKSQRETPPSCLGGPTTHVLPFQGAQAPSAPLHTLCFPLLQCVPMYRCPKSLAPLCIPRLSTAKTAESLGISAGFQQSYL